MKVNTQSVNFTADQKLIDFIQKRMDKLDVFYDKLDEVYKLGRYSKYVRDYLNNIIKEQILNV